MTGKVVRFTKDEFHYVVEGDIRVTLPREGSYHGIRISGDREWILPDWFLIPSPNNKINGFSIDDEAGQPVLYVNWTHRDKDKEPKDHRRCIGVIDGLDEARLWINHVNARYQNYKF
jgi:hypothetical protein